MVCPGDSCHVCRVGGRYLEPVLIAWSKWGWGKETASLPLHPCSQSGLPDYFLAAQETSTLPSAFLLCGLLD